MSQTFAQVVEDVKQLSLGEKQELLTLLNDFLIEDRRREILENHTSIEEVRNKVRRRSGTAKGKILMSNDFDEPLEGLADH